MKKITVGSQLKEILKKNKWTQRQLATMINVPFETFNRWVNDVRPPSHAYARILRKELKIFIDKRQS